jgi:hypothetical protein
MVKLIHADGFYSEEEASKLKYVVDGLMVSVETKGKEQFLRIVEVVPKPPQESYQRIFRAAKNLARESP